MSYNKIANHRQFFQNYATQVVKNSSGTELTFGSVSDEGQLERSGTGIVGFFPAYADMYLTSSGDTNYAGGLWGLITGSGHAVSVTPYNFTLGGAIAGSGKFTYDGSSYTNQHSKFLVNGNFTISSSVAPLVVSIGLANSTSANALITSSVGTTTIISQSVLGCGTQISFGGIVSLSASQVLCPMVKSNNASTITFQSGSISITQL